MQGTLPLKELTICNLQQNGNYSQPQEFALQINGELTFNLKVKNDELHVLVVSRTETAWSAEMLESSVLSFLLTIDNQSVLRFHWIVL